MSGARTNHSNLNIESVIAKYTAELLYSLAKLTYKTSTYKKLNNVEVCDCVFFFRYVLSLFSLCHNFENSVFDGM